jgi:hypothetical protein
VSDDALSNNQDLPVKPTGLTNLKDIGATSFKLEDRPGMDADGRTPNDLRVKQ